MFAKLGLFLACGLVIAARMPDVLLSARFWAEEGLHFSAADHEGVLGALRFVHWRAGYYNLVTNAGCALGSLLPIQYAPAATTYLAFAVQLVPVWLITYARGSAMSGGIRRVTWCLAIIFLPTMSREIWLNTINSQIFLGVTALLVLVDDSDLRERRMRHVYRGLVAFAGLSGVYAVFLQPVFMLRAILTRNREHVVQASILTLVLVVQLVIWAYAINQDVLSEKRDLDLSRIFVEISRWHFGVTFFGDRVQRIDGDRALLFLLPVLAWAALVGREQRKKRLRLSQETVVLLCAYVCWSVGIALTALHGHPGGRYAVAPSLVIVFILSTNVGRGHTRLVSGFAVLLLLLGLWRGVTEYREGEPCNGKHPYSWAAAVRNWDGHSPRSVPICPDGWLIELGREPE